MKQKKTNRNFVRFGALLALVAMWVVIPFAIGDRSASAEEILRDEIRIRASLTGAPINGVTPVGSGDYSVDDQGRARLDVDGSSINLPAGTVLTVSINNAVVGNTTVSSCGTFLFRRRTDDGQQVPVVTAGMPVQVSNGGTVILSGTFGSASPSPSPSGSPAGTPSPSPSPCASPSPTGSPTASPSPSPTGSPTGSPSPSPSPSGTPNAGGDLFAGLTGPILNGILPNGFAQFEIHSSRLELEVRVNQVNLPGSTVQVIVDGVNVGSMFISGGEGRLRLRTDNGQTVPAVVVGSTIAIQNGGSNILTGTFAGFTGPSPSPSPTASPSPGGTPSPSPSPSPSLGRSFESHMTGAGMQPSVQTNATGEIKVTLNTSETQATIFGEFHGLGSAQTGARIEALVGDGSVVHDFGIVGGSNGNFASVTIDVTAAQVSQIRSGLWSAVITSTNNPSGEIRGTFRQRSNLSDFDGDGRNDLAVFRPSEGAWYSLNGSGFTANTFGTAADKIVSADYDGDGRTDIAVFQNVNGVGIWQIKRSADGGVSTEAFGYATDLPARGDFDGDGISDIAVYRPSSGVWYIKKSNGSGYISVRFGAEEDRPMPLDMDGDGRDDIAVFRPSSGMWYWLRSSDGQFSGVPFGQTGDIPVRGDFDGDGRSDITVFRPSNGVWYTYLSSTGDYRSAYFGMSGDVPVAGNYDGDNKADIAVFRPSDGVWYILRSTDGAFQAGQFGLNGDRPVGAR